MIVRRAEEKDFEGYYKLQKEFIGYMNSINESKFNIKLIKKDLRKHFLKAIKKRDRNLMIIEEENKSIGFIDAIIIKFKRTGWKYKFDTIGHLNDIFIQENYRRKGYFKEALNQLLRMFKQRKIKYCNLMVDVENEDAINSYQKLGFKIGNYKMLKEIK